MIDAPVDTVDGFVRARPHARRVRAPQNAVTTNTRSSSVTLPDGRRQLQPQSPPMLGTFASTVGRTPLSRFKPHNSTASAANASGFVQTALSRVTRRTIVALGPSGLRRVTPDRVLSFVVSDECQRPVNVRQLLTNCGSTASIMAPCSSAVLRIGRMIPAAMYDPTYPSDAGVPCRTVLASQLARVDPRPSSIPVVI